MKIRFDSRKEHNPTREQGLEVLYAPGKRVAFRLRWYLILFLVASPLLWFVGKVLYGFWLVDAPAQLRMPVVELRARDAGVVTHLDVRPGDRVEAGQRLIQLDNPEWRARMAQLRALPAGLEASAPQSIDGHERQVLSRQLERARQRVGQVQALLAQGAATRAELIAAESERDARESDLLAFDRRQRELSQRPYGEARDLLQQHAEQAWLESRLQGLELHASAPGLVAEVLVGEGENVGPGTLLMRLEGMGEPVLWIYLEPRYGRYAQAGQPLEVRMPDGNWLKARILQQADRAGRLPSDLRSPFAASQLGLLVPAALEEPLPERWRVDQLPLQTRFPNDWAGVFSAGR